MSQSRVVISAIGQDRPGIVSDLAEIVHGLDLNVEDSRMTVLGSQFALLMSVTGPDDALEALAEHLDTRCPALGLAHLFRRADDRRNVDQSRPLLVSVVAMDHPGIVHDIAAFFSGRDVNIEELETETAHAPHTGTPIFNLSMRIAVPGTLKLAALREAFEAYCTERDLDGMLQSIKR